MSSVEGYSSTINGSSGNSAPFGEGGRRRRRSATRRLKLLKSKLRKLARGGAEVATEADKAVETVDEGGLRKRHTRRHKRRTLFGLRY